MVSYFIVAHCTFATNCLSKLESQFQVIFGQDSFPLKMSPSQVSLLQNFWKCLLGNGWRNTCFSPGQWMAEYLLLPLLFFYKKVFYFPSLLASAWFVIIYFSFVEQTVLVVFPDYSFITTKSPISFFICLHMVAFEYF